MSPGVIADRYELGDRLGSGGMSTVYKATDRVLERTVAVKVLAEHLSDDEKFVARFRREALAVAKLVHPNIVQVYDTGVDQGRHFIVMEYVEGKSGAQLLQRDGALRPGTAVEIAAHFKPADPLLPGKLSVAFDVRRQLFAQVRPTELPHQNPKAAAPALYRALPPASLLLVDLGYFSFPLFDQLSDDGYWFISKQRRRTSATVVHTLVDQPGLTDELIWLGAYRADQARHLVRRITVTITTTPYVYLTNVLDPGLLSAADVVQLYGRRWDIELAFKSLKQHLGLGVVWSAHWELILTQVWGALLIAQIASALRQQIALRAGIDLVDVSLALLLRELPQVVRRGEDDIVGIIAGLPVTPGGFLRKARRVQYVIPVPKRIIPPPDDLVTIRMGRSSGRKCAADRSNRPRIGVPAGG